MVHTLSDMPASITIPTPAHSRPPSPKRISADIPLCSAPPPAYTSKWTDSTCDSHDVEHGLHRAEDLPASESKLRLLLAGARLTIGIVCWCTMVSFPCSALLALVGGHLLAWQFAVYAEILTWRYALAVVLCGCAIVACVLALPVVALAALGGCLRARGPGLGSEVLSFLTVASLLGSIFAFALGAAVLQGAHLPAALTAYHAFIMNGSGLFAVVMLVGGCLIGVFSLGPIFWR